MTASDRLDEIRARYVEWHEDRGDHTPAPDDWRDADPGESMEHCIVRNDVPVMSAALWAVLDLHTPFRIYQASSTYEANEAEASGADPIAILCVECMSAEAEEAAEDCEWDDGVSGSVRWPCDTVRAVEGALGEARP